MTGGVSARLTALEVERPDGRRQTMVVRRHGAVDLGRNPNVAADEFRLLQLLHAAGLPVPRPYYLDAFGEALSTPSIVIEYVDGTPESASRDLSANVTQQANSLLEIHEVDLVELDLSFLPRRDVLPPTGQGEDRVREVLERVWPLPERNRHVLLHGDFWPGNVLWRDGRLVAVVDWENAAVGDPLADLTNARLELLWASGVEAMGLFTRHYESGRTVDLTDLPYWDLFADLRLTPRLAGWGLDDATERTMREQRSLFVAQALRRAGQPRSSARRRSRKRRSASE